MQMVYSYFEIFSPNNPVFVDLNFHMASRAFFAVISYVGSPSSRLKVPNSRRRVPTPAEHVVCEDEVGTPYFRFTYKNIYIRRQQHLCLYQLYIKGWPSWTKVDLACMQMTSISIPGAHGFFQDK